MYALYDYSGITVLAGTHERPGNVGRNSVDVNLPACYAGLPARRTVSRTQFETESEITSRGLSGGASFFRNRSAPQLDVIKMCAGISRFRQPVKFKHASLCAVHLFRFPHGPFEFAAAVRFYLDSRFFLLTRRPTTRRGHLLIKFHCNPRPRCACRLALAAKPTLRAPSFSSFHAVVNSIYTLIR